MSEYFHSMGMLCIGYSNLDVLIVLNKLHCPNGDNHAILLVLSRSWEGGGGLIQPAEDAFLIFMPRYVIYMIWDTALVKVFSPSPP